MPPYTFSRFRTFAIVISLSFIGSLTAGALTVRAQCNTSEGCCDETCYAGGSCTINGTHQQGVCQVEVCSFKLYPGGCNNPPDQETSLTCVPEFVGCGLDFCPESGTYWCGD